MNNIDFTQIVTPESKAALDQSRLKQLLAEHRWIRENEGVNITGSARFQSDRTTRAEMTSLLNNLELGTISGPVIWKALSGWEVVGKDQLRQILWLLNAHVQACFTAERQVERQISSAEVTQAQSVRDAFSTAYEAARTKT